MLQTTSNRRLIGGTNHVNINSGSKQTSDSYNVIRVWKFHWVNSSIQKGLFVGLYKPSRIFFGRVELQMQMSVCMFVWLAFGKLSFDAFRKSIVILVK